MGRFADLLRPISGTTTRVLDVDVEESSVELPGAAPEHYAIDVSDDARAVTVRYGPVGVSITDGQAIRVHAPDAAARSTHDFLAYGVGARTLLWQRRRFNLHAALLTSPTGETVALTGLSGAGKSSTTLSLIERGWEFDGDDVIEVTPGPDGAVARAVPRPMHLSDTAARRAGVDPAWGREIPGRGKRAYAVQLSDLDRQLARIVVLGSTSTPRAETAVLGPLEAVPLLAHLSDGWGLCHRLDVRAEYLAWVASLCRTVPVRRVDRPVEGDSFDEVADLVSGR